MNDRQRLHRVLHPIVSLAAALAPLLLGGSAALAAQKVTLTVGGSPIARGPEMWAFWILGGLTVLGAVAVITRRNPVVAAVCLVGTLFVSAGLYLLLHATFMAVIQVLVYAGAIMVLFVLVVMAVEHPEEEELGLLRGTVSKIIGVAAGLFLMFCLARVLTKSTFTTGEVAVDFGTVSSIGKLLFSDYLFPFEAISILLLVSIVGAVVVSRSRAMRTERAPSAPKSERGHA
jgi:NADH-quinone oxidoreductase subunit J